MVTNVLDLPLILFNKIYANHVIIDLSIILNQSTNYEKSHITLVSTALRVWV